MLTKSELESIRKELETSKNPLFIFHDDGDGLCSFLLCYRYVKRGHGELIKRLFTLTKEYEYLIKKHNPDKIFILDIPIVEQEFLDSVNVPVIWIDHHPLQKRNKVKYFNSRVGSPDKNFPVSYICYIALKNHLWIGMMGAVSDYYLPEFKDEFSKKYPDLLPKDITTVGQALYETRLGELIRYLSFSLKAPMYKVKQNVSKLLKMEDPHEIEELYDKEVIEKYNKLKTSALKKKAEGKFFIYKYEGKLSFIGELANELIHLFPDKIVIVARENEGEIKASLRTRDYDLSKISEIALSVDGEGGGHEKACGAKMKAKEWEKFLNILKSYY